jgi:iron complex transport system substrate-binding protein
MRIKHGRHVLLFAAALLWTAPLEAAPKRIVSTFLCTDEYVFRMVPRERIAALSFEAGDRNPIVSTIADQVIGIPQIRPSTETVLNRHPDLVVMYAGTNPRLHENLRALHIPILDVPWANSLTDIHDVTKMLGAKLGAPAIAARLLAEMDATLAQAKQIAPQHPVRALIYEPNGYSTGGSAITAELMARGGLIDAAPDMKPTRLGTIPIETLVAAAPELLILAGQQNARRSRADLVLHHPALRALPHTRVEWASTNPLLCPGPWSAQEAIAFAELARKTRALARRADAK